MVRNAALAVFFAIIGIFLYIAWAFRKMPHFFRYSAAAVFALSHDVLIVLGLFSLLGKIFGVELNTMVITAILAVIGYSINNTIVVFDRIRENMLRRTGDPFDTTVNNSLSGDNGAVRKYQPHHPVHPARPRPIRWRNSAAHSFWFC